MTAELRFHLLGAVSIALDERPLGPFRSRTAEALLIYLAMHRKTFSRQVLADMFWDERPQKQALSNLRTVLALLRRQLDEYLIITRHTVAFNHHAPHWIDATTFRRQPNLQSPIPNLQSPVPNLQSLLTLYHGDFLSGFSLPESQGFQAWTLLIREELHQLAIATLQRLNDHFLAAAQYHEALPYAQRLLHMNPLDDLAQRQMMELLWRSGQRNAALKIYDEARQLLAQELSVEPDAATTALYNRIRASSFPPPCTAPTPPTTFIGREEELAKLTAMLANPQDRLITILGPGGAGKTRLLIEAIRQAAETPGRFMDGVYFIPLADLSSPAFLPTTVAQHIGLTFHGQTEPDEQVLATLRAREMLLALDNVEHLLTNRTRRWLAHIIRDAPGVRIIVTSRARLGLQGEQLLPLAGLAAPPETTPTSQENAEQFPAVRLFCARAAAVNVRFSPDASEMLAIARLCRLLDGLPLGLELAAAGASHLSCVEIAAHVRERLDWQFGHFPDRPRRHQNLQAVFAHSWDLLSAENQVAARRLSVFAGPFNSAAAHAVARVLPAQLSVLSDHSLLSQDRPGRFTFHPLIHRFLSQKMEAHPGEAFETARRLVDYVTQLPAIEGKGTNMESRYQELKQVMVEQREQVVAAALWLARRHDFSERRLVTLLEALIFYFAHEGQLETWKVICRQLLQALGEGTGDEQYAAWLAVVLRSRIAEADLNLHAYERAEAAFSSILPQALRLENGALISFCHHKLGQLASRRADFDVAYRHFAAALPPLQAGDYGPQYAFPVYRTWTEAALVAGDLQQARAHAEEAYRLALRVNSREEAEPIYTWALGEAARQAGELAQALANLQRASKLAHEKDDWRDMVRADTSLALVLAQIGDGQSATTLATRAYDLATKRHERRLMALAARAQGRAAECSGDIDAAAKAYRQSLTLLTEIGDESQRRQSAACLERLY